ncbi:MAG: hypothetical protein KIG50_01740 [Lachnospiraceae bacterium]|nr:hypothetical protein [Lachnospiraceae bacterium]
MNKNIRTEYFRIFILIFIILSCMLTFALIQPFGDGPDEINRFKVVEYIYQHGTLPNGADPEVLIDGYGASYAFQPILTYMIDGYLLHALRAFNPSLEMRVFISRLVNILFGCLTAFYVKKISNLLFSDRRTAWAFTLAVVFLPQNVFIHTYVNTDSMGLLSIAMILHALLKGMHNDFHKNTCIQLAIGIILCALSYYNCYGIILCAVLFFSACFIRPKNSDTSYSSGISYDYKSMLQKGVFISVIVLVGISWWFIRNAILYNGDFLALNARNLCAAKTGLESYNPFTRDTYQRLGISVGEMVFGTDYFTLVWKSFIAMFGPMLIPTHHYIYMAFRDLFFIAVIGLLLPLKTSALRSLSRNRKLLVYFTMLLALLIPIGLALYYSYTFDFQPQGRYYLPMVIPFMFFLSIGLEKIIKASDVLYHILYAFLTLCLLYATFVSMLGYYR